MQNLIVRNIVATIAGIIVAGIVVALAEGAGHLIFPTPEGLDLTKPEDQARLMEIIPMGAKIAVVVAWFLGALAGTLTARKLGSEKWPAWLVAAVMIGLSYWTTTIFPHPLWMVVCAVALPVIALSIAGRLMPLKA